MVLSLNFVPEYVLMPAQPWEKRHIKKRGKNCSLKKKKKLKISRKMLLWFLHSQKFPVMVRKRLPGPIPTAVLSALAMHVKSL